MISLQFFHRWESAIVKGPQNASDRTHSLRPDREEINDREEVWLSRSRRFLDQSKRVFLSAILV